MLAGSSTGPLEGVSGTMVRTGRADAGRGAARVDDAELVALCERGHARLTGLLTVYTGDPWLADELAQEALVRLCARWDGARRPERPNAWLNRVAINLANSTFRRRRAARRAAARHGATPREHRPPDSADAVAVRQAVAALPARAREAVVLRWYEGWTTSEIGAHLGLEDSSVRSLLSRAVSELRASGLGGVPEDASGPEAGSQAARTTERET